MKIEVLNKTPRNITHVEGTFAALMPSQETVYNLLSWSRQNGILLPKPPYGKVHITALSTARTIDVRSGALKHPLIIPAICTRLRIVKLNRYQGYRLWCEVYNDDLNAYIDALHNRARHARPPIPMHATLAYKVDPRKKFATVGLPFNLVFTYQEVSGFMEPKDIY